MREKQKAMIGMVLFYLPFHIFLSPTYWDDAKYAQVLEQYQYDLIRYTARRYSIWSSRITIELLLPFLTTFPTYIWKILNLLMLILLYYDLTWLTENVFGLRDKKQYRMTAILLCAFPFSIMAQTGWIATTTNYLWVLALGGYAITRMLKAAWLGQRLRGLEVLCAALAVIYSASFESMAAILFLIGAWLFVFCTKEKKGYPAVLWVCQILTMLFLVYILCCPGNRVRPIQDAETWMPEFFSLSFLDKLRMGILSSYMHFVSLPSPIFFILNVLLFFVYRGESAWRRLLAALPVLTDVMWTGYFMLNYLMGWRTFTYQTPVPLPETWGERMEQGLLLLTVVVWFCVLFYTLFYKVKAQAKAAAVVLLLSCLPEIAVGLTPTVIASILRTMIYLYMALILLVAVLMEKQEEILTRGSVRFCQLCMAAGVLMNACQIARHIMLYG